jgi:hypothetical protein
LTFFSSAKAKPLPTKRKRYASDAVMIAME